MIDCVEYRSRRERRDTRSGEGIPAISGPNYPLWHLLLLRLGRTNLARVRLLQL